MKRCRLIGLLGVVAVIPCSTRILRAQQSGDSERTAVLAAVDTFFAAMTRHDTVASRAILLPGAVFYHIVPGRVPRSTPDTAYLRSIGSATVGLKERIWNPRVEIHGPIAEVWTWYDFHVDGKFSHCGIDDFSMIKTAAGWQIASATYTIETTGCPESPLGPLPPP
jgi:hypothetical protein